MTNDPQRPPAGRASVSVAPLPVIAVSPDVLATLDRIADGLANIATALAVPRPVDAVAEPWPFGPGTVVRDEEGAEAEWLEVAPEETVVLDGGGTEWVRRRTDWFRTDGAVDGWITSVALAGRDPVIVVSVPGLS